MKNSEVNETNCIHTKKSLKNCFFFRTNGFRKVDKRIRKVVQTQKGNFMQIYALSSFVLAQQPDITPDFPMVFMA